MNPFLFLCSLVGAGVLLYVGLVETGELRAAALSGAAVLTICVLRG